MENSKEVNTIEIKYLKKYCLLNALGNLVFVILGFYLLILLRFDLDSIQKLKLSDYFVIGISILFVFSFGKKVIIELLSFNKKIIFSKNGIEIDRKIYSWQNISKEKIISKKEYTSKYRIEYQENYLNFMHKNETVEVKIQSYNTDEHKIKLLLEKFKKNASNNNVVRSGVFDRIISFDDYLELEEKKSEKVIKETQELFESNKNELIDFCKYSTYDVIGKLEFLYYALSDDFLKWENFLVEEFIRIFELAKKDNSINELLPILENIMPDENETITSSKIRGYLIKELDNKEINFRLKALQLLNCWIDEEQIKKEPNIVNRITLSLQDADWRMRWNAHTVLKGNDVNVPEMNFMDKLKGKILNPYEI